MKTKILIFGSTGMAGHMIYEHLVRRSDFLVANSSYRKLLNTKSILIDVRNVELVESTITEFEPNVIINCIGILKSESQTNSEMAIYANAYFPHLLSKLAATTGGRLIHISTDCVFSGAKGSYRSIDPKDAQDLYGMSKALGEVINSNDLTIRTSIIGPEIKGNGEGLLHWFLNANDSINGYTDSFWSGVTTLQLAKFIEISIDLRLYGLIQYSSIKKISKYELLILLREYFNREELKIVPVTGHSNDKSLLPSEQLESLVVPTYQLMCNELSNYMSSNKYIYSHYFS
jgi:dTDP-4-dehydrorhamnose reductase